MKYTLYCDVDGVLADFDGRFMQFSEGIPPKDYENIYGITKFWELIDETVGLRFWVGIPWLKDGKKLWSYIKKYKPILLSAPSRSDVSKFGKRLWVKNHLRNTKLILSPAYLKQEYANENSILIDDRLKNIQEWNSAGGIGIHHTSLSKTLKELKKLGL